MSGNKYTLFLFCLLVGLFRPAFGQQDTLRVLFVGNSYTYFWNLPQTVEAMSKGNEGMYILARQSTAGGVSWQQHWEGEKDLESRRLIKQGNWDVVVLQNHSRSTIDHPERFKSYGKKFVDLVQESGATPVLYMTWARAYDPLMQETISAGYRELGKKLGVQVVPVGELWKKTRQLRPNLILFDPDGSHPSTIGTYLTACAFYTFLSGQQAIGLPKRITRIDRDGQKMYLSILPENDAVFLQGVVDTYLTEQLADE